MRASSDSRLRMYVPMPKSCSLRASMPMRTLWMLQVRVVELVALTQLAALAREDVALARGFLGGGHRAPERRGVFAEFLPGVETARRHGAGKPLLVPHREPLTLERSGDAALVAHGPELLPSLIQGIGVPGETRE